MFRFTVRAEQRDGARWYCVIDTEAPAEWQPHVVARYSGSSQAFDRDAHERAWKDCHTRNAKDAERLARWDKALG